MSFFMLHVDDLVFTNDVTEEVMAVLAKGTPVTQHWKTKEYSVESMSSSYANLVPFSAGLMAQAVLNRATADEEAKNS